MGSLYGNVQEGESREGLVIDGKKTYVPIRGIALIRHTTMKGIFDTS